MKYTGQISTGQYEYLNFELEGTAEEAVAEYKALQRLYTGGSGIGMKKLAEIIVEYCTTKGIVNGHEHDLSTNEALLVGEIKKLLRKTN